MKTLIKAVCVGVLMSLFAVAVSAEDIWTIYECNKTPDIEISDFTERIDSDSASVKIISDPDIAGNKLLEFSSPGEDGKYRWTTSWGVDTDTGATIVFRAKGLDSSKYARVFEIQYGNEVGKDKFIGLSDNTVLVGTAGITAELNTAEWHIYRLVITTEDGKFATTVYVDEKPAPLIDKAVITTEVFGKDFLQFGDASGSNEYGSLFDWIIWTTKGAFSPKQMPLPENLTGILKTK